MDRATIEFNFSRAIDQASKLEDAVERIKNVANSNLKDAMQYVSVAWKGENSQKYISKGDILSGKMFGVAGGVNSVASTVRAVAKNIYDAEMEALRIEEERAYQARLAAEEAERKARDEAAKANKNKTTGDGGGHGR
jgi:uncharacterized protein YukE